LVSEESVVFETFARRQLDDVAVGIIALDRFGGTNIGCKKILSSLSSGYAANKIR
jgi:hypothetical protein